MDPEHGDLDDEEDTADQRSRGPDRKHGEPEEPDRDEHAFDPSPFDRRLAADDRRHRVHMQLQSGQRQQRQEEPSLSGGEPCGETSPLTGVLGDEDECAGRDVTVDAGLVRVGVVQRVVLLQPPSVAEADEQVADDRRHPLPRLSTGEDLSVGRIVGDIGRLGEQRTEDDCGGQLPPALSDEEEHRQRRRITEAEEAEPQQIPSRAPGEEAGFLDLCHEGAEVACELLLLGAPAGTPAFEHLGAGGGIRGGSRQGGAAHFGRVHTLNARVPTPIARHPVERFSTPYPGRGRGDAAEAGAGHVAAESLSPGCRARSVPIRRRR